MKCRADLYGRLTGSDQPRMPQAETAQREEAGGGHERFEENERSSGEDPDILIGILHQESPAPSLAPPMLDELLVEDFKSESHNEATADDHEDHVEEEVSVVEVSDTVASEHTVVFPLEDAEVAGRAVPGPGWGDGLTDGAVVPVFPAHPVAGDDDVSGAGVHQPADNTVYTTVAQTEAPLP